LNLSTFSRGIFISSPRGVEVPHITKSKPQLYPTQPSQASYKQGFFGKKNRILSKTKKTAPRYSRDAAR
jgi:hypothetical protein